MKADTNASGIALNIKMKKKTLFWMGIVSFCLLFLSVFLIITGDFGDCFAPWLEVMEAIKIRLATLLL